MARWFAGPLAGFMEGVLNDSVFLRSPWINRGFAFEMFQQHRAHRADHSFRLWMILNLEVWYRLFVREEPREAVRTWIGSHLPPQPSGGNHSLETGAGRIRLSNHLPYPRAG
jgi:hypothetical protein